MFPTFHKVILRNDDITFINWEINSCSLCTSELQWQTSLLCLNFKLASRPEYLDSHSWILDPNIKICYQTTCDQCLATERINDGSWQVSQATQNSHEITKDDE